MDDGTLPAMRALRDRGAWGDLDSIVRVWWARRDQRPDSLEMPATEGVAFKWVHYLLVLGAVVTAAAGILLLIGSGLLPISPAVTAAEIDR